MQKTRSRASAVGFIAWVAMLPFFYLAGAISTAAVVANAVAWLTTAGAVLYISRRPRRDGRSPVWLPALASVAIATTSLFTGPLLLTATFASTFSMGFTLAMRRRDRYVPMVTGCVALSIAWLLDHAGIISSSLPTLLDERASFLIFVTELVIIVLTSRFTMIVCEKLIAQHRSDHLYAWQLRQLLPKEAAASSGQLPVS